VAALASRFLFNPHLNNFIFQHKHFIRTANPSRSHNTRTWVSLYGRDPFAALKPCFQAVVFNVGCFSNVGSIPLPGGYMTNPDLQMQTERMERAIAALAAGEYKVTALEPGAWSVINGDNVPYRVTHQTCECKDFENIGKHGIRCKHICAIHILFPQAPEKTTPAQGAKQAMEQTLSPITGWTRLYHPAGVQVTIPIPLEKPISPETAQSALTSVSSLLDAGWLVDAPGLEEGEQKQEVVSVSRRESKDNTPIVAFYLAHPKTLKKFLHAYRAKRSTLL
jgi:hypothetical protein